MTVEFSVFPFGLKSCFAKAGILFQTALRTAALVNRQPGLPQSGIPVILTISVVSLPSS